jgi:protein O-mannosyl-transferase
MKSKKRNSSKVQHKPQKLAVSKDRPSTARISALLAFILILNLIAYVNSFKADWHFDDLANIVNNRDVQIRDLSWKSLHSALTSKVGGHRPVSYLTFALNYYLSGLDVGSYHALNFIIHTLNAFLVFALVLLVLKRSRLNVPLLHLEIWSFFVAAFWSTNPLQTQSVTYIIQRMNLLACFFFLLSLIFYIRWRTPEAQSHRLWNLIGCVTCALLAFGSKENSFILPITLLAYEIYFVENSQRPQIRARPALLFSFMVVGLSGFVVYHYDLIERIREGYTYRDFSMNQRLLTQPRVVIFHLSQLLLPLPSRLALHHEFDTSRSLTSPPTTTLSFLLIGIALGIAVLWRKSRPVAAFFILWYFITLAIESSFFPLEMIFEHRVYLPSIGVFVVLLYPLLVYSGFLLRRKRIVLTYPVLAVLIFFSVYFTYTRNEVWKDDVTLWQDNVEKYPQSYRAQNNLGTAFVAEGQTELAEKAFEESIRLNPNFSGARINLALLYLKEGRSQEAIESVEGMEEDNLDLPPDVYFNLGVVYAKRGQLQKAIKNYREAIDRRQDFAEAYFNLALACLKTKAYAEAKASFSEFLRCFKGDPNSPYILEARNQLNQLEKQTP